MKLPTKAQGEVRWFGGGHVGWCHCQRLLRDAFTSKPCTHGAEVPAGVAWPAKRLDKVWMLDGAVHAAQVHPKADCEVATVDRGVVRLPVYLFKLLQLCVGTSHTVSFCRLVRIR